MKKKGVSFVFGILAAFNIGRLTVFADDILSKEEVINELWEERWFGDGDDGTEFPEASFNHHLIEQWVNEHYDDKENYDWSDIGRIDHLYSEYYNDLTGEWIYTDEDGKWYITDEEEGQVYHFTLFQGEWNMIDSNGNTVDTFKPFSTLDAESEVIDDSEKADKKSDGHKVVAENNKAARQKASEWSASVVTVSVNEAVYEATAEHSEKKSNAVPIAAGVAAGVALTSGGVYIISKKKG